MDNITERLYRVAENLKPKNKEYSKKVLRIAQEMQDLEGMQDMQAGDVPFDPSQESQIDSTQVDPTQMAAQNYADESGGQSKVPIESFVKITDQPTSSNYEDHVCSVSFSAPPEIEESDMMNYILGIGKELGVEVKKFDWEKLDNQKTTKR
jgi:hypothetical protein